ncbi:hypothetical protein [Desulfovibrio sp. TomC]|uniref:hypothetical protein n=1 Tax=Desulfovibrio sp. TomC TaxID=1562888 RepID=UPI0012E29916|nr:hypothetical protein [Desulfovibrio sp. TomC]
MGYASFMAIAAILISCFSPINGACETFKNKYFSITLPPGWISVPADVIKSTEDEIIARTNKPSIPRNNYAFQQKDTNRWFSYPYILINISNPGRIQEAKLQKISEQSFKNHYDKEEKEMNGLVSDFREGRKYYDKNQKILWVFSKANIPAVGSVSIVEGIIPTNTGYIKIFCYAVDEHAILYQPIFQSIISSVIPSEEFAYRTTIYDILPAFIVDINWGEAIGKAIAWSLLGGVLGFFGYRRNRGIK